MIFLQGIGIALLVLALLGLGFMAIVSLLSGLCNDLEHEKDDETLKALEKWREGK